MQNPLSFLKSSLMNPCVLTAAWQDVRSVEEQQADPVGSSMASLLEWIDLANETGLDLQVAASLHGPDSYVAREEQLDPVARHWPGRTITATEGVEVTAEQITEIYDRSNGNADITSLAFFGNPMHEDPEIRAKDIAHTLRVLRGAVALRQKGFQCRGVTGFIGRDATKDLDQNLELFEEIWVPIFREFKTHEMVFLAENCPMPGANTRGIYVNNLAYCAGMWIALHRILEKYDLEDVLRLTYDESHDILMGNNHEGSFAAMAAAGLEDMFGEFHGKQQNRDEAKVALWGMRGQDILLGCRVDGQPHPEPKKRGGAWRVMTADHSAVGIGHYNPRDALAGLHADWIDHQLAARRILQLDPSKVNWVFEHEWNPARKQDRQLVKEILILTKQAFMCMDGLADMIFRSEGWCQSRDLVLPGRPNPRYEMFELSNLDKLVAEILP